MKLESQVCSLELAKRLKELGVKQDSIFTWTDDPAGKTYIAYLQDKNYSYHYSAFTVAELGEMLPSFWSGKTPSGVYHCHLFDGNPPCEAKTEADARAKLLIYLIENGKVKP